MICNLQDFRNMSLINFKSPTAMEYLNQSLNSRVANGADHWVKMICRDGEVLVQRMRLLLFSPLMKELCSHSRHATDMIQSFSLPDTASRVVRLLADLISKGHTDLTASDDLKSIIDVAKSLGIHQLRNFTFDCRKKNIVHLVEASAMSDVRDDISAESNDTNNNFGTVNKVPDVKYVRIRKKDAPSSRASLCSKTNPLSVLCHLCLSCMQEFDSPSLLSQHLQTVHPSVSFSRTKLLVKKVSKGKSLKVKESVLSYHPK